jgi:hypothetical protein
MRFAELPAKEINARLLDRWGLSIFKFAQILATCAGDWLQLPEGLNITKKKLQRKRRLLLALGKHVIRQIREIEAITSIGHESQTEGEFFKAYGLEPFFYGYLNPCLVETIERENSHRPHQGARITKKSILAASWGSLIYQNRQRMNWSLLADLYEWFWERLHNFPYYASMKPPDDLVNYLTVQYHRHSKDPDSFYCVRAYGQREFLIIFASDVAFVDRSFAYVDDLIEIMHKRKRGSPHQPWEHELAFRGNDLAEYLRFSASLYTKYGKPPLYRSALIVFPDKSSYSSEF